MRSYTTLVSLIFATFTSVHAGSFTAPIVRTTIEYSIFGYEKDKHIQDPITPWRNRTPRHQDIFTWDVHQRHISDQKTTQSLLDDDWDYMSVFWSFYTTPVGVGNPPLRLNALVDTKWSTFFVTSANCTYEHKDAKRCRGHTLYNSTSSSTYHANLTRSRLSYKGIEMKGSISQDSLHMPGLEVKNQMFQEALDWGQGDSLLEFDRHFDTALGLSLYPTTDEWGNFSSPSLFSSMMEKELLDENIFTLKFARNDWERGELTLGAVPPNIQREEMIEIPLAPSNSSQDDSDPTSNPDAIGGWQIPIAGMSMDFDISATSVRILEKPHTAVIASAFSWIGLPYESATKANEALGMTGMVDWIDCETRSNLPNWTLAFGVGNNQRISLTPWDYLIEVFDRVGQLKCVSVFYNLDSEPGWEGYVVLGAPFLNGLYSVFDADRKSISFSNRPL